MRLSQCDNCKKEISSADGTLKLTYYQGKLLIWHDVDLCERCAQSTLATLRRKKLLPAAEPISKKAVPR